MFRIIRFAWMAFIAVPVFSADVGVRIRFGLTDSGNTAWDGNVTVSPGAVERIDGWRFQEGDRVVDANHWTASTRPLTVRRSNAQKKMAKKKGGGMMADNGIMLVLRAVTEASLVKVETKQGNFSFRLSDIPYGRVMEQLKGSVDIERVAATRPLTAKRDDDDFPAIAVGADGNASVAWISFTPGIDRGERARMLTEPITDFAFLAKPAGGDRLWLRTQRNGTWSEPIAITGGGGDLYKCAVAVESRGRTWVIWSENTSWPDKPLANFEIFAASVGADGKVSAATKLSAHPGTDVSPVAATDASGRVWVAWQAARENSFRIVERHLDASGSWSTERIVSTQTGNCWVPAIAAASDGRVAIAWDTYDKGDYDVWVREFAANGSPSAARPVANSEEYEARAALTYDKQSRLWIAWERSGPTWGKDWGALDRESGIGLYRDRQIGMLVLAGNQWQEPAQSVASALPGSRVRRGPGNLPVNRPEADMSKRKAGQEAESVGATTYNNIARLACDRDGRIWLFARSREGTFHTPIGSVWMNYAASYDGERWTGPTILPHSDNLLYNTPAVVAHPGGGFIVAHSSDHRMDRHVPRGAGVGNAGPPAGDPFDNDIFVSRLEMASTPVSLKLAAARNVPAANVRPSPATLAEREALERARAQRITYDGKPLQLVRGEFHRHTEVSGDGGNDGPVEDMWRYAIDVAAMDWLGNGDHDNGNGREYTWWLIQKTTDAFRLPGRFDPPFTYERSVSYPEGHRNVVFAQRGVRTLPRLPKTNPEPFVSAPDTMMLYEYLRHFKGVCASHTSATDMGTDWRNHAPDVEPMVEIYQGCRQSYERPGAPRSPTENDSIGGWRPKGFVNLALKMGYQFSFQSSSDHNSTHISYAMVYAEDTSREALLRAMRARHTYGATDNIVADYRCRANGRDYMLGDAFSSSEAPTLRLKLAGTSPFAKVTLVKDDEEIHSVTPNQANVELTWTDPAPKAGKTSYYYFRGEQTNGELVWVSPMWITYTPAQTTTQ
ncbi:MAG: hypothetical protein Q7S40_19920 [Opitutaceae bacterium]|nr:hypothetical protein [Opitutaceae bacterium]